MTEQEAVREAMKTRGYNQTFVAEKAGFKGQSTVAEYLRSKHMRVDNLVRMLNAMDFDLVVVDRANSDNKWKVELE